MQRTVPILHIDAARDLTNSSTRRAKTHAREHGRWVLQSAVGLQWTET